jgi:hypothetical protein
MRKETTPVGLGQKPRGFTGPQIPPNHLGKPLGCLHSYAGVNCGACKAISRSLWLFWSVSAWKARCLDSILVNAAKLHQALDMPQDCAVAKNQTRLGVGKYAW